MHFIFHKTTEFPKTKSEIVPVLVKFMPGNRSGDGISNVKTEKKEYSKKIVTELRTFSKISQINLFYI